jgi:hypothetical protein
MENCHVEYDEQLASKAVNVDIQAPCAEGRKNPDYLGYRLKNG